MKLIVWSITLTHFVFCQITRLPQCHKYAATFKVSKRKSKTGRQDGRITFQENINFKERCGTLCIEHSECKSAFYLSGPRQCHLYYKKFEDNELEESTSRLYIQPDGEGKLGKGD